MSGVVLQMPSSLPLHQGLSVNLKLNDCLGWTAGPKDLPVSASQNWDYSGPHLSARHFVPFSPETSYNLGYKVLGRRFSG